MLAVLGPFTDQNNRLPYLSTSEIPILLLFETSKGTPFGWSLPL